MMLEKIIKDFFCFYYQKDKPFLLALSGGPDSLCLFYLLSKEGYSFHVAHVDHGWRAESYQEALHLQELCEKKGIPFHLCRLNKEEGGNLEEKGRQSRYAFFKEICREQQLAAVVLGHHADDQAETVLKRLFEGATLSKLKGLIPRSEREGMTLLRPLLEVKKKEILEWLEENKLSYFQDSTNLDNRFLRGRMRQEILPLLSNYFQKEIPPSLCRIGQQAAELQEFLTAYLEPYRSQIIEEKEGIRLVFTPKIPITTFEWKAVIYDFFEQQGVTLSAKSLEMIIFHLRQASVHKWMKVGSYRIEIDRRTLFFSKKVAEMISPTY